MAELFLERLKDLHPSNLRYLFYAVTPSETTFANVADIPDYQEKIAPWMLILTLVSLFCDRKNYAFNDSATSVVSGNLYLLFKISGSMISVHLYTIVYEAVHLIEVDIYNPWVWVICFFTQDLVYYLGHRAMHEWGIFWALHQMHHSSEYYNFATAMRKGVFMELGTVGFNLLQCFFIPPQIFIPHRHLNFVAQFWLHNEYIPELGPLEYIFCTPSNHRVHHGRNPYCIGDFILQFRLSYRNYGGVLIIWDRMFGTYAAERPDEKIVYGLVEKPNTFNQLWLQMYPFYHYLIEKGQTRDENGKEYFRGFWNKLRAVFVPPGYFPGMKTNRFLWWNYLADNTEGIPRVDPSEPRYNPEISFAKTLGGPFLCILTKVFISLVSNANPYQKVYIFIQGLMLITVSLEFDKNRLSMDWLHFCVRMALIVYTAQSFSYHLDKHPRANNIDLSRNVLMIAYVLVWKSIPCLVMTLTSLPALAYFISGDERQSVERAKPVIRRFESIESVD